MCVLAGASRQYPTFASGKTHPKDIATQIRVYMLHASVVAFLVRALTFFRHWQAEAYASDSVQANHNGCSSMSHICQFGNNIPWRIITPFCLPLKKNLRETFEKPGSCSCLCIPHPWMTCSVLAKQVSNTASFSEMVKTPFLFFGRDHHDGRLTDCHA